MKFCDKYLLMNFKLKLFNIINYNLKIIDKKKYFQKGISLLELIIYIAVFSVIAVVMIEIFFVTMRGRDLANARYEIASNLRFATEQIRQTVFDASAISVSGICPSNILNATSAISSATSSFFISVNALNFIDASG